MVVRVISAGALGCARANAQIAPRDRAIVGVFLFFGVELDVPQTQISAPTIEAYHAARNWSTALIGVPSGHGMSDFGSVIGTVRC